MVTLVKYLIISLLVLGFTSCSYLPTIYKVGEVATPLVVKDKNKKEKLKVVDEAIGVLKAPK